MTILLIATCSCYVTSRWACWSNCWDQGCLLRRTQRGKYGMVMLWLISVVLWRTVFSHCLRHSIISIGDCRQKISRFLSNLLALFFTSTSSTSEFGFCFVLSTTYARTHLKQLLKVKVKVCIRLKWGHYLRSVYISIRIQTYGSLYRPYTYTSVYISIPFHTHNVYGFIRPPYTCHFMQCLSNMKRPGVFLRLPGWHASPSQG